MKTENSKNYIITGNFSILYFLISIKYKIYLSNDRYKYKKSLLSNYTINHPSIISSIQKKQKFINLEIPKLLSSQVTTTPKKYGTKKNLDTTVDIVQRTLQIIRIKKKGNQHNYVPFPSKKKVQQRKIPQHLSNITRGFSSPRK